MNGKQKCRMLKEIRQRIADENDIPYVTKECRFQGECAGTCPRCESELRYLERELARRRAMKKRVTVAALCAGMVIASAGCSSAGPVTGNDLSGEVPYESTGYTSEKNPTDETGAKDEKGTDESTDIVEETGEVPYPEDEKVDRVDDKTESTEELVTSGMVPYPEENSRPSENDYGATDSNE